MSVIPERYHFVWTGRRFPYFARLAIESVLVAEPTATVVLHLFGEQPTPATLAPLARRVAIATFDPARDFDALGALGALGVDPRALRALFARIPPAAASARSNLVRYAVLARHGGIYLDCDVLLLQSLRDLRAHPAFVGEERVLVIDAAWQAGERAAWMLPAAVAWLVGRSVARVAATLRSERLAQIAARLEPRWQGTAINNAVIGAIPGSRFVRRLLAGALAADPGVRYALGPTLITEVVKRDASDVAALPPPVFYAIPPSYSFQFFTGGDRALPIGARLLHVVSSNHRALMASLDEPALRARAPRHLLPRRRERVRVCCEAAVTPPLISCLMVTRDRARLAGRALRCFAAQTWPALELVVVDDGDEDYEPALAPLRGRFTVRYCKLRPEAGRRLGALRNLALEEARGELCAQWDDDEWYHPDRLATQARAVLAGDAVACVLKATLMHVDTPALADLPYRADAGLGTPGTIVHRRSTERYPNLARNEDGRFLASLARRGRVIALDRSHSHLFVRCFHGGNTWDARHFERRLRRTPVGALHWVLARLRGDLRTHPQLRLNVAERDTIDAFLSDGRTHGLFRAGS